MKKTKIPAKYSGLLIEEVKLHNGEFIVAWSTDEFGFGLTKLTKRPLESPVFESEIMDIDFIKLVYQLAIDAYFNKA